MAAEDVRSEAMRTLDKLNDAFAVIKSLEDKIEEARILDIKKETKFRKERESYEMAIEDYNNECYRLQIEVALGEQRIEYLDREREINLRKCEQL